jgi:glutamyl-tRNA synthetase
MDEQAVRETARRLALENAVGHGGKAAMGSVMGGVMAGDPGLRQHAKQVQPLVKQVVDEVNALAPDEQAQQLEVMGGARKKEVKKRHPFRPLPALESHAEVVMRFAPNPNGPATLGHSRGMVTLGEYKRLVKEEGKQAVTVLRFDDTDPQVKPPYPPAYEWIQEDYRWLYQDKQDLVPDRVVRASDRLPEYYKVAQQLIEKGAAYVCECDKEEGQRYRKEGKACPHRERPAQMQLEQWRKMLAGDAAEGSMTLRIKTQVDHRDPALRDWVAFRVAKTPHPMVGDRYPVWPMLDFESAVEDRLQGVTHIIRGKDLMDSTRRQEFLYKHMGWTYPHTLYWGRVRIDGAGSFSSSGMRKGIEEGRYTGWDDPRLPTLRAMRRRGIQPLAIRRFWVNMGLSEKDVAASMLNLYAENEKLVEREAPRFFFVHDPVRLRFSVPGDIVQGGLVLGENPVHPDHPERGVREHRVPVVDDHVEVFVEKADLEKAREGGRLRLKGMLNLEFNGDKVACTGTSSEEYRKTRGPVVQWLPGGDGLSIALDVHRPEETDEPGPVVHAGRAEAAIASTEPGTVVRFERYGFVCIEKVLPQRVQAVFTHQ